MEQMKNKNLFLISCMSCIVLLLMFCYFGINLSWKSTYSATTTTYTCSNGKEAYHVEDDLYVCFLHDNTRVTISGNGGYICSVYVDDSHDIWNFNTFENIGYTCDTSSSKGNCDYSVTSVVLLDNACWKVATETNAAEAKYTVNFNKNYTGSVTNMPSDIIEQVSSDFIEISSKKPTSTDKTFKEWNTKYDGSGTSINPGDKISVSSNVWSSNGNGYGLILYAIWDAGAVEKTYTVNFNKNYTGSVSNMPLDVTKKVSSGDIEIPTNKPTVSDKTFKEWNTKSDGTGTSINPGGKISVSSSLWLPLGNDYGLILYAIWQNNVTDTDIKTLSFSNLKLEYNGNQQAPKVMYNNQNIVSQGISYYTNSTCTTSLSGNPVDAGTYYVKFTSNQPTVYSNIGCTKFEITPKKVSVSWTGNEFKYTGSLQGPEAKVVTGVTGETMTLSTSKYSNVGTHTSVATCSTVTGGGAKCSNYELDNKSKTYKIVSDEAPKEEEKTFVATFDKNGGVLNGKDKVECTTTGGSCNINDLPSATRDGYTFNGWGTNSSCTTGKKDSLTLSKNTTYYACYSKNEVTTPEDDKPSEDNKNTDTNPGTGDIAIAITWFIGLLAIGYSFYYFKNVKES